ncbi:hypothetical protein ACOSP7_016269 [Xanthoceras sorbifolium]|uniref:Late embryogenesis abundant protein LEA-2 subgroup domain-containing protein n=1 Tax=Xanthoceras sorbifolium TaxID=99658 RepID=A0ABQ8HJA2_9ROSI|nr:hypothetical protein JRO89_XS10G0178800 [Xanthoceras sorbifolium]
MPTTTATHPPAEPSASAIQKHTGLFRCITIFFLALIVIVGVTVMAIWLVIRPKRLIYTIDNGSIHNFNLTNNHLDSTFNFVIRAHNPNGRASIYYESIEVSVAYNDQNVAFNTLEPFRQPTRNITRLETRLVAQNAALSGSASRDLKRERSLGKVELDVHVKAKIRFKVGIWKSRRRTLKVLCSRVVVPFSSSKKFERTDCDIDL